MTIRLRMLAALAAMALEPPAAAQAYPDKPVRIIVPVVAGGTPDVVARMVTPGLASLLGHPLIIDNRGGAGGLIAAELAAKAVPDGYTLFFSSPGSLTILPHMQKEVAYDTVRDFAPVSLAAIGPFLLIAHPSLPAKSVREMVALAQATPGKLNYGSAGSGAANHLAMELFKNMASVNITHVPYKGAPQAVADLIGGDLNLMFNSIPPVIQHLRSGRLKLLGVSSARRSPQLADTPTISEAGVPGYESITWFGLLAPAKTPKAIVARLNELMIRAVRAPELKTQLENLGYDPVGSSAAELASHIRAESEKYAKVVKLSGAKID